MTIYDKGLIRAMKAAYRDSGYDVAVTDYGVLIQASDWAGRWHACGMFNRPWGKQPVMREVVPERTRKEAENTPMEGQIRMEV